ncbi:MAG TPA: hypothetical protein VFV58_34250 [Blastocatellia bacterium]|jgi:parallel beta-helix repeat protein|nr:hypothetical protein [Blastocatellia bacterium]
MTRGFQRFTKRYLNVLGVLSGIGVMGPTSAEILDNEISDNTGSNGGGIYLYVAGTPIIKRNIIKGNNTVSFGQGGGI